ncbi:MAG: hypothetical protein Q8942_02545 [Bacillota bacterium]|nr:hypothetical protein [Bacillota bacterium]
MSLIIGTELKSDLEHLYKITGDILTLIDMEADQLDEIDIQGYIRLRLLDINGTLQKDIFNCDYLITKEQIFNGLLSKI